MTYSAAEGAARYLDQKYNEPGYCLRETREAYGIGSLYADAAEAWRHALGKHPGDTTPPYGAPVYWEGGESGHGHIAIYVGDGQVRSSDAGGHGVMGTRSLDWFRSYWGLPYAGWAESVNGVYIPGLGEDDEDVTPETIREIAKAVWAYDRAFSTSLNSDGSVDDEPSWRTAQEIVQDVHYRSIRGPA